MNRSERSFRAQAQPIADPRHTNALVARESREQVRVPYRPRRDGLPRGNDRRRSRRPARAGSLKRTLLAIALLAAAGAVLVGVLLWGRVSEFNSNVSTAPAASTSLLFPLNGSDPVNVVMFGYGGDELQHHGGRLLTDSINILSIDPQTDTTTLIPIPRDLWIEDVAAMGGNGKVNEAFALGYERGGIEEAGRSATAVLSAVTGLKIEHWMAIDFTGFREMVDAVGGVTIENPTAFEYTWDENFYNQGIWNAGSFAAGTLHLDGEQALAYARSRYTSEPSESSDFARSIRQQRIMSALKDKLGEGGLSSIGPGLGLMDALQSRLKTDLSAIDLFLLSGHLGADRRLELPEDVIVQAEFNSIGQYVLVVIGRAGPGDYGPLHAFLAEGLAQPIEQPSAAPAQEPAEEAAAP